MRLCLPIEVLHFLLVVLAGIAIHVQHCLQSRQQNFLNPISQHFQTLHLASVQLCQLEGHLLKRFVDEVILGLFGEVELGDRFEERSVEGEGVFEVSDEILDEIFSVFYLLAIESLQGTVNPDSFALADPPGLHVLLQLLEIQLLALGKGHMEELVFLRGRGGMLGL